MAAVAARSFWTNPDPDDPLSKALQPPIDETPEERVQLAALTASDIGRTVTLRARLQTTRAKSGALVFVVFRKLLRIGG